MTAYSSGYDPSAYDSMLYRAADRYMERPYRLTLDEYIDQLIRDGTVEYVDSEDQPLLFEPGEVCAKCKKPMNPDACHYAIDGHPYHEMCGYVELDALFFKYEYEMEDE